VLAQRPDLKTPAWIDRKLPTLRVRRADFAVGRRERKKMNIVRGSAAAKRKDQVHPEGLDVSSWHYRLLDLLSRSRGREKGRAEDQLMNLRAFSPLMTSALQARVIMPSQQTN